MNEIEKRARELLAVEWERVGCMFSAEGIRAGVGPNGMTDFNCAIAAIVAALSEQQEVIDWLHLALHRRKQQSLRRARTIKARNKTIRELQGAQP